MGTTIAASSAGTGGDIAFQRSTNQGLTFSSPIVINSRPGQDRVQWFPWATVDSTTGRVYVFYYDQGIATSGDLTETTYQYSDDGGMTWHKPMPLTDRPFHAGYGNNTGRPNIGDYNQAVAQNGDLFVVWAGNPNLVSFADGEPTSVLFTVPDIYFKRVPATAAKASLRLGAVTFTDSNGNAFIDAGEQVSLKLPLENYVTNPVSAAAVGGITGTLTTTTPGVIVMQASSSYADLAPGAAAVNAVDYVLQLSSGFAPGTHIEVVLNASSSEGSTTLLYTLPTGTPTATTIFSENFNSVASGTLPAGWATNHAGGSNEVKWTTSSTFNPGIVSNGAFHTEASDGITRFEELFSPQFTVPSSAEYVTLDFDTKYDTRDDLTFNVLAYNGFTLRIADFTTGRLFRLVLPEAFAEEFTTGSLQHLPKHLPNISDPAYFPDMSVWAGSSGGIQHVHMKLPGMAGSTVQLRFEYTQYGVVGTRRAVRPPPPMQQKTCGVHVDNIVVQSVVSAQPAGATQTINFPVLADKTFGDLDFSVTATASSGLPVSFLASGNCTISGAIVHLTGPGSCTIKAFQPGNATYNPAVEVSRTFAIAKANQTINFGGLADKTFGDPDFTVAATASSGLAVSFVASGSCTVSGATVHLTGAGSCAITANYNPAHDVSRTFAIAKAAATLSLSNLNQTYDGSPKTATVTTSPPGLSGVSVTYAGSITPPINADSYAVVASLDNSNYAAPDVTGTLVVGKAAQTITFGALADKTFGDPDVTVAATASSGLPVSFAASGNCTVAGATVHLTGAGSCTITASQSGNANYNPAPNLSRSFTIRYNICLLYDSTKVHQSGSTIPIRIQLCDASGNNVSSSSIVVQATSIYLASPLTIGVLEDAGQSNPDDNFRVVGPPTSYIFNLKTKGLATGTYHLTFTVGSDTATYAIPFQIR